MIAKLLVAASYFSSAMMAVNFSRCRCHQRTHLRWVGSEELDFTFCLRVAFLVHQIIEPFYEGSMGCFDKLIPALEKVHLAVLAQECIELSLGLSLR